MYWNSGTSVIDKQISNRLTLTWDVLKLITSSALTITDWWLTLTWDVLKCVTTVLCCRCVND